MFKNIWGRLPTSVKKRPFDIFVALFLVSLGVYQIIDPEFPEIQQSVFGNIVLTIISLYMIAAGLVIVWCIIHKCSNVVINMYTEMYAWLFMWAAVFAITIFQAYIGVAQPVYKHALYYGVLWFWILLSFATAIRWIDLLSILKRVDK